MTSLIRYNLDPFAQHTDAQLAEALEVAQLTEVIALREGGLMSCMQLLITTPHPLPHR